MSENFLSVLPKRAWLKCHFGKVSIAEQPDGVVARVPLLYKCERFRPSRKNESNRDTSGRDRYVITPIEVKEKNKNESIAALFHAILEAADKHQGIDIYCPKPGQSPDVIKADTPYEVVQNYHPEHIHGSPRLIDFVTVNILRGGALVIKGSFIDNHCHFLID